MIKNEAVPDLPELNFQRIASLFLVIKKKVCYNSINKFYNNVKTLSAKTCIINF